MTIKQLIDNYSQWLEQLEFRMDNARENWVRKQYADQIRRTTALLKDLKELEKTDLVFKNRLKWLVNSILE